MDTGSGRGAPGAPSRPAGWYDESHGFPPRYWDGSRWTWDRPVPEPALGPVEAVVTALRRWSDRSGRSRRSEFWWFLAACAVLVGIGHLVGTSFALTDRGLPQYVLLPALLFSPVAVLHVLHLGVLVPLGLLFVPLHTAAVRRLHDTGRRSVWLYACVYVPLLNPLNFLLMLVEPWFVVYSLPLGYYWLACGSLLAVVLLAVRGDDGRNRYGPSPRYLPEPPVT